MNVIDFDIARQSAALVDWTADCRKRMASRYPEIDFDSSYWPLKSLYGTKLADVRLEASLADFDAMHPSFKHCLRAIMAEAALSNAIKSAAPHIEGFRLLNQANSEMVFDLTLRQVQEIESNLTDLSRRNPRSAAKSLAKLDSLGRHLHLLSIKGVLPLMQYQPRKDLRTELIGLSHNQLKDRHSAKREILDHQIAALSDAMTAMSEGDARLSDLDHVALSALALDMCAPSRINEILCMSIDDSVDLSDYVARPEGQDKNRIHQVHQALIMTMKGSKGADWGAKPVLNFMIDLFNHCMSVVLKHGERSRRLVEWYERNPNALYLPADLEHLRGRDLTKQDLWCIVQLQGRFPEGASPGTEHTAFYKGLGKKARITDNPRPNILGKRTTPVAMLHWKDVEDQLLERVRKAMRDLRRVTLHNHYEGPLSRMLFLLDRSDIPFLPGSLKYQTLTRRFHQSSGYKAGALKEGRSLPDPTIFEKLGITIPLNGEVTTAFLNTHDTRRWLTTQALKHKEKLSDALINKWARRVNIAQLKHYDFRTPEEKADQSAMPVPTELADLSNGIDSIKQAEKDFGIESQLVTIDDASINVTSMDAIAAAVANRPIARTSEQIVILYPTWYGACLHQHHETPCRAYSASSTASCLPCDYNVVVKGHLPTNNAIRERSEALHKSIVNQLEALATVHNRGIADDPDGLASHILTLVEQALNPEEMATHLVERFHEIKHAIKDVCFASKLEEAFVAQGMVKRLNSPHVSDGALIKYHNPRRHASPGVERALDAHGGRERLESDRARMLSQHPEFAPTSIGLHDQRSLALEDGSEEDDDA